MLPFALKGIPLDAASSSRAFIDGGGDWDYDSEWDEELKDKLAIDPRLSQCVLRLKRPWQEKIEQNNNHLKTSTLLVGLGNTACAFLEAYVLGGLPVEIEKITGDKKGNFELIGGLFSGLPTSALNGMDTSASSGAAGFLFQGNSFTQRGVGDASCFLYMLNDETSDGCLLCLCRTPVQPYQWHHWTHLLLSLLDPNTNYVGIFSSESVSHFLFSHIDTSESQPSVPPFLRSLKTRLFRGTPACPYLEQPNLIQGLAAQLLTYCQIREYPAVLYVAYTAAASRPWQALDVGAVKLLCSTLKHTPLKDLQRRWPQDGDKTLQKIIHSLSVACEVGDETVVFYPTVYT